MKKSIIEEVKLQMGYSDGTYCCKTCKFYVPTDCSGSIEAKNQHCNRNTFNIKVVEQGKCNFYAAKYFNKPKG